MNEVALRDQTRIGLELSKCFDDKSPRTIASYKIAINQFLDFHRIGINQIHTVTTAGVIDYLKSMDHYAHSSFNAKVTALRSLYNKLNVLYGIENPFHKLKAMKIKTVKSVNVKFERDKSLTIEEGNRLIQYFRDQAVRYQGAQKKHYANKRYSILLQLLFYHGLRISEALNMKTSDITKQDEDLFFIHIIGKGDKSRTIKIDGELVTLLKEISNPEGLVFTTFEGKPLQRSFFHREIKRITKRIIGKNISAHIFRHSFFTNMLLKHPERIKAISSYGGHADPGFTLRVYCHDSLSKDDIKVLKGIA